jgi:Tfp pilus assembly protein PilX
MFADRPPQRIRRGFALPMAILTLALITAAIVAAYSSTSAEVVTNNAMRAQDHAYQLAEAGLQQFMLRRGDTGFCSNCVANPAAADSEWTRVTFTNGYANVVATRVRPKLNDANPALFFIRSTGVDTTVKMGGAGITTYATRTVGQYGSFGTSSVKALSAWTSFNGVTTNLGNALFPSLNLKPAAGNDACTGGSVAGIAVPKYGSANYRPDAITALLGWHPQGSPRVDSTRVIDTLKKDVGIDWDAIQNYNALPADVTITALGGTFPTAAQFADTSYWPVIRVKTNLTLAVDGRGILIVDGRLTLSGAFGWEGIVLVGNDVIVNSLSTDSIAGVTVSGLNRTLPGATNPALDNFADNDVIQTLAGKLFQYNSCKAARAAERLTFYFAWPNTWLDNVAIW